MRTNHQNNRLPKPPTVGCASYCPGMYAMDCKNKCPDATCNAKPGNIGGAGVKLLVLDIGSFDYTRGGTPTGGVPATCCDTCKNTTGCNAWVSCNSKDVRLFCSVGVFVGACRAVLNNQPHTQQKQGCGSGCLAYAAANNGQKIYKASNVGEASLLPLVAFGSFRSCQGDRWPFGMCSLKAVPDASRPPLAANGV